MDPATITMIVGSLVSLLTSALIKAGKSFADKIKIGEKLGEVVGEKAATLYEQLTKKEAIQDAVQDIVSNPEDEDAQGQLRVQLKKLLAEDTAFAESLTKLLDEAKPEAAKAGISIVVSGEGAVATDGGVAAGKGGIAIGVTPSRTFTAAPSISLTANRPISASKSTTSTLVWPCLTNSCKRKRTVKLQTPSEPTSRLRVTRSTCWLITKTCTINSSNYM